jgi:hypothetical protein
LTELPAHSCFDSSDARKFPSPPTDGRFSVQLSHEAIFQQWALSTYLQAAIMRSPFVELPQMLRLYEGMLAEGTKQAEVSARVNEDLAHSELRNSFLAGQF